MICFIAAWLLTGFASAIHWPFVLRRSLAREHPLLFSMDEPLLDFYEAEFWFIATLMTSVGPIGFLVTYLTCRKDFWK
jgi:hypothetical protein